MPVINNLKRFNLEPIYITKEEWLNKVNTGEINDLNKSIYYIKDDFVDPAETSTDFAIGNGLIMTDYPTKTLNVDTQFIIDTINDSSSTVSVGQVDGVGLSKDGSDGIAVIRNNSLHASKEIVIVNATDTSVLSKLTVDSNGRLTSNNGFSGTFYGNAYNDKNGKNIADTYVSKVSLTSGKLSYTNGSGNITDLGAIYTPGTGVDITGNTVKNTGVLSVGTGSSRGTISVNTNGTEADVSVNGLGSAAFESSDSFALLNHNHDGTYAARAHAHSVTIGATEKSISNSATVWTLEEIGLRSGTAVANTTNCPRGCWYGQYSDKSTTS